MTLTEAQKLDWLGRIPLFQGCDRASLMRLAERTSEVTFPAGAYIVTQGQVGNGLFLLMSGRGRVVTGSLELAELGPGDVVGELSVIDQLPRIASVVALEPADCLALAAWDLLEALQQDHQLGLNLLRELARRLRAMDARAGH
jgi:CRP/FNR family transcriptional regulator